MKGKIGLMRSCDKQPPREYLAHHGIKGQRWGVRRYQNEDGTLTEAGKSRLGRVTNTQKVYEKYGLDYNNPTHRKQVKSYGVKATARIQNSSDSVHAEKIEKGRKFALQFAIFTTINLANYVAAKSGAYTKAIDFVNRNNHVKVKDIIDGSSDIFSKTLGRNLTIAEAIERGLM